MHLIKSWMQQFSACLITNCTVYSTLHHCQVTVHCVFFTLQSSNQFRKLWRLGTGSGLHITSAFGNQLHWLLMQSFHTVTQHHSFCSQTLTKHLFPSKLHSLILSSLTKSRKHIIITFESHDCWQLPVYTSSPQCTTLSLSLFSFGIHQLLRIISEFVSFTCNMWC